MGTKNNLGRSRAGVWIIAAGAALLAGGISLGGIGKGQSQPAGGDTRAIDDFSVADEKGLLAAGWRLVATPGVSARRLRIEELEGRRYLHLTGTVAPTNQAGFVQASRPLAARGRVLDAGVYFGIQLRVQGNGGIAALHLRTRDTRGVGQYYRAEFATTGQWQEVKLLFGSFLPVGLTRPLDPSRLVGLTLVVGGSVTPARERVEPRHGGPGYPVDIYVDKITLYREPNMNRELTPEEERIIVHKGTEAPFTGKYTEHFEKGVYTCRRCGAELFESSSKFRSHCGWPSFDDQIPGRVKWQLDADGRRTEIICATCGAHLGHVFAGEEYTEKNLRYCVNSLSMDFLPADRRVQKNGGTDSRSQPEKSGPLQGDAPIEAHRRGRAIFAAGCFWGVEYYLQRAPGVRTTTVGFIGGHVDHPTYKQVCTGTTGHAEAVEVSYDPSKTDYETLAKLFFEIHDFTQVNRQGPDIGQQYRSAIFYLNDEQKQIAERLVAQLRQMGYDVKTEITKAGPFWSAEDYHQDYYNKNGETPYCHIRRPIFPAQPEATTQR